MVTTFRRMALVTLILFVTAHAGLAQRTTATFAGIVADATNAVLPGAEVNLINEGTSATIQMITNETGEFLFDFVPPGAYTLKISMPGFRAYESRGFPLGAGQSVRRTYNLEVGSITDSVTVTGEAPLVNTLSPEQRLSLDTLQVMNLPIINRNVTAIIEYSGAGLTKGEALVSGAGGVRFRMNGLGGSAMTATANGTNASGFAASNLLGGYGGFTKIDINERRRRWRGAGGEGRSSGSVRRIERQCQLYHKVGNERLARQPVPSLFRLGAIGASTVPQQKTQLGVEPVWRFSGRTDLTRQILLLCRIRRISPALVHNAQ